MILRKKVVVPVPAGIEDGQTVRMPVGKQEVFITFKVTTCLLVERVSAHCAMCRWIDPLSYFSFQPVLYDWYVLSCLWDCKYKMC